MNGAGIGYNGALIGIFDMSEPPVSAGEYTYMPMRCLPHLEMSRAAKAGHKPKCSSSGREWGVTFEVLALPRPHVMKIGAIEVTMGQK